MGGGASSLAVANSGDVCAVPLRRPTVFVSARLNVEDTQAATQLTSRPTNASTSEQTETGQQPLCPESAALIAFVYFL